MKSQTGFALVQVLLFGMLAVAVIYGVMMVETRDADLKSIDKNATVIGPALSPFLQYAIISTISTYKEEQTTTALEWDGSTYYTTINLLGDSYITNLKTIGFEPDNVIISSNYVAGSVALSEDT